MIGTFLSLYRRFVEVARRLGGREPAVLAALLAVTVGIWGFIELADQVWEGHTQAFDVWMVKHLRRLDQPGQPIGPEWLAEAARDITALGGIVTLLLFTMAVVGYLWLDRKRRMAIFLLAATTTGWWLAAALKQLFGRPRPDVVPHLTAVTSSSFPSGHAMMSAVVYLSLGVLLASVVSRKSLKVYTIVIALGLTVAVGVSRIYLGVHYPTDVLAGWATGLTWALVCWLAARWLQWHGRVECGCNEIGEPQ